MKKLNILKPQESNLNIFDKNISYYNKSHRQLNSNTHNIIKSIQHQKQPYMNHNNHPVQVHHKLQIQRSRLKE